MEGSWINEKYELEKRIVELEARYVCECLLCESVCVISVFVRVRVRVLVLVCMCVLHELGPIIVLQHCIVVD
jgi:hypothetical protein